MADPVIFTTVPDASWHETIEWVLKWAKRISIVAIGSLFMIGVTARMGWVVAIDLNVPYFIGAMAALGVALSQAVFNSAHKDRANWFEFLMWLCTSMSLFVTAIQWYVAIHPAPSAF